MKTRIEALLPGAAAALDDGGAAPSGVEIPPRAAEASVPSDETARSADGPRLAAERDTELIVCPECYAGLRVSEAESEVRCTECRTLLELLEPDRPETPPPSSATTEEVRGLFAALRGSTENGWWQPPRALPARSGFPQETPLLADWRALGPAWDGAALLAQASSVAGRAAVREVLVVDDAPEMCALLATAAGRAAEGRVHVTAECDSVKALERVRSCAYDVVVSDIDMPGATGYDVMEAAYERNPAGHRIIVTASDLAGIAERLRTGIPLDAFLHKSVSSARITAAVSACLAAS